MTFKGNTDKGRHNWLRLTPAYSVHVVRDLLQRAPEDARVLDPFSGTGTTPLVCATVGREAHSVDINPFLVWLGNLKLRLYTPQEEQDFLSAANRLALEAGAPASAQNWLPPLHQIEKWWSAGSLDELRVLFASIVCDAEIAPIIRDLLKMAFCQVMIATANVSFGHQSMSFKKTRGQGGHSAHLFDTKPHDIGFLFYECAKQIAQTLGEPVANRDCRVFEGDSRALDAVLPCEDYGCLITSPPYPNRMSYIRELRPYMYWLGFLNNGRQAGELDWQSIGGTWGCATSRLADWTPPNAEIPYPGFNTIADAITQRHALLGTYVRKYFYDILEHLQNLRSVLKPGARCHYIVGNSSFYGTLLPTEKIYASLFKELGFSDISISVLRKRTSKRELYEFLVEAVAP